MSAGQTGLTTDGPGRQTGSCGFACGQHHVVTLLCLEARPGRMVLKAGGHPALALASWPGGLTPAFGLGTDQGEGDGEKTLCSAPAFLNFQLRKGFHGAQLLY